MLGCGLRKLRVIRPTVYKLLLSASLSTVTTGYRSQEDMAAKTAHPLEVRSVFNINHKPFGDTV